MFRKNRQRNKLKKQMNFSYSFLIFCFRFFITFVKFKLFFLFPNAINADEL